MDFRKAHRRDKSTGAAGTSFGGGGRLWSEAEPACHEVARTHLNDLQFYCERGGIFWGDKSEDDGAERWYLERFDRRRLHGWILNWGEYFWGG
jgi:hypothetical protein